MRRKSIPRIPLNLLLVTAMIVLALPAMPQSLPVTAQSVAAAPEGPVAGELVATETAGVAPRFSTTQELMAMPQLEAPVSLAAAQELTDTIYLSVVSARTELSADVGPVTMGDPVEFYKYIINQDNTGDPFQEWTAADGVVPDLCSRETNEFYPAGCEWPAVRTVPGWAPIVTQGTQENLNTDVGLTLPPGKYLISVLGDGFKLDGEHFTVPMSVTTGTKAMVEVRAHPLPLPPASMTLKIFHDRSLTNGQFDAPVEEPQAQICEVTEENPDAPYDMAGFLVSLNDIAGEVTTDLFGNPLCTQYVKVLDDNGDPIIDEYGNAVIELDADGNPVIQSLGKGCFSDHCGNVTIPNIGPIRWDVLVTPPDGEQWIQTTTLEGSHGWDTWLQENGTGLDNEFLIAGEPFPWTIFGFVAPVTDTLAAPIDDPRHGLPTGTIKGVIMGAVSYTPFSGGLPYQGQQWAGFTGTKLDRPIANAWLALNDLQRNDTAVWVGQSDANGSFEITGVPEGDYSLTYWDEKQHYILDFVQISVVQGQVTDIGVRTMTNWFTEWSGYVFLDYNENGMRDPNEPGVPDYTVVLRDRDNTEIDRMSIASVTDATGFWELEKGYPMGWWMVLEAYHDLYRPTGYTYQTSNQPEPKTILGAGVDVAALPILGQWGHLDWGVVPWGDDENGGIAGSVFYDTVRAEDDARYAGAEPWQPGIPDLEVQLWRAAVYTATGEVMTDTTVGPNYGAVVKGEFITSTTTERFVRPVDCQARDADGNPADFEFLAPSTGGFDCVETLAMGTQFGDEYAQLPGNWGFGDLKPGKYLVEVVVPTDPYTGDPVYQVTREEDVNTFDGDTFEPLIPPPACAGPLHVVDIADYETDNYPLPWDPTLRSTPVENPNLAAEAGSRYEGKPMPLCNVRLVELGNGRTIAPTFSFFTDVMIPGRWKGYIIDDMKIETDPTKLFFGEKAGVSYAPIGIYDWTGELEHTIHSDYHGVYEVLLPSDQTTNAPSPSGMLANMYYIYGNDPGQFGNFNDLYNPAFRSIGTTFEVYPGVMVPSDLAPIQNGVNFQAPGSQQSQIPACLLEDTMPQIFRVSRPYAYRQVDASRVITITGVGFGAVQGEGGVALDELTPDAPKQAWLVAQSWNDREIVVEIPQSAQFGPHQLLVWSDNGERTRSGITIHVLGGNYTPQVLEVGPDLEYTTIQSAIDAAAGYGAGGNGTAEESLVVVYPGATQPLTNALGIWFENPVIYSPVKLQGVGAGGVYTDGTAVRGTVLDGRAFGGDTPYTDWWRALVAAIWANRSHVPDDTLPDTDTGWDGTLVDGDGLPIIYEGPVVSVYAEDGEFTDDFEPAIDGFTIQGGHQQGQPTNITTGGLPNAVLAQGGGVFVNGYASFLQITNNVIQSNGGSYAGGIRVGTPDLADPNGGGDWDLQNDSIRIGFNRILANGGTNLAGAVGLFNGTEAYEVDFNDICGNFSAEYGGGISHFGMSPGGSIHNNRIYFNRSYDEGGGIMIAGELPAPSDLVLPGAGPVDVYANLIQANLGNDDGGGLRFLMAGDYVYNVHNNMIVNNISTHEGGGISINDTPNVRVYNNTIMKNMTTATAMTSNGEPAPAGLSTARNSSLLQNSLPVGSRLYSTPLLFNNIFWDNRAGTFLGGMVTGLGLQGDTSPLHYWDLGSADNLAGLEPTYSLLQVPANGSNNIIGADPEVIEQYDTSVNLFAWRGNPNFVDAMIVAVEAPVTLLGNYHLTSTVVTTDPEVTIDSLSPAVDAGTDTLFQQNQNDTELPPEPSEDIDGNPIPYNTERPNLNDTPYDMGADEVWPPMFPLTAGLAGQVQVAAAARPSTLGIAGVTSVQSAQATYRIYLPIIGMGDQNRPTWSGDLDSFDYDSSTGTVSVLDDGELFWNKQSFGNNQEVYLTFESVAATATRQDLVLKANGLSDGQITADSRMIVVSYDPSTRTLGVSTLSPGNVWQTHLTYSYVDFEAGDQFGARSTQGGLLEVYRNGRMIGVTDLSGGLTPWAYSGDSGFIGVRFQDAAGVAFTEFGGGTIP
ncbi:MAG: hypothetical protein JXC32_08700 [Anaerolineae bacterium]|nr:hypothetical protein [Anaerolineae bacterium]